MPHTPHCIIPAAASAEPGCPQALAQLRLPHLGRLLARLAPVAQPALHTTEDTPHLPHELALAQALGLPAADGMLPWAAAHRVAQDHAANNTGWAYVTPCHWQVGTDHITLQEPEALGLDEAGSRALLAVVAPWFAEDGITLHYDQPGRWLAHGALLAHYASPSLARVAGADLRHWMQPVPAHITPTPAQQATRTLQRLHSEIQMLLYTHPFNDARTAQGLPPINAFWVHGAGALPPGWAPAAPLPTLHLELLHALRQGGPAAWAQAWQALDAGPLAALLAQAEEGAPLRLTLCSDHAARTWHSAPIRLATRIQRFFRPQRLSSVLEKL
ncbi:phosphoglycerate mutase [Acidovorax sp.]|uniref:phosphoglycerate mutase n=1 Tax=Acidovorax sp. TaxID=1872122 RepID=UPI00261F3B3C|nr:phosphoglycerate mutase [Acidovorax sp.]